MTTKSKVLLGILGAAAAGVVIGLLIAPEKGKDMRKKIRKTADDWADNLGHLWSRGKEAAEDAVHPAREPVLRRVVRTQQDGAQCRRQRQRIERRDHGADRDRHRELLVELPRQTGHEGQRHEQNVGEAHTRAGFHLLETVEGKAADHERAG